MLTIIQIEAREDGGRGLESQSHRTECWQEGWIAVPEEFVEAAWSCAGFCDLEIKDGVVTNLTPRPDLIPPQPEPEASDYQVLNALLGVE